MKKPNTSIYIITTLVLAFIIAISLTVFSMSLINSTPPLSDFELGYIAGRKLGENLSTSFLVTSIIIYLVYKFHIQKAQHPK